MEKAVSPEVLEEPTRANGRPITWAQKIVIATLIQTGQMTWKEMMTREGMSKSSLSRIMNDPEIIALEDRNLEPVKKKFAGRFYQKASLALEEVTPEKLKTMSAYQATMIAATLYDKARLADGQSTANLSIQGALADVAQTVDEIRKRRASIDKPVIAQD